MLNKNKSLLFNFLVGYVKCHDHFMGTSPIPGAFGTMILIVDRVLLDAILSATTMVGLLHCKICQPSAHPCISNRNKALSTYMRVDPKSHISRFGIREIKICQNNTTINQCPQGWPSPTMMLIATGNAGLVFWV